MFSRLANLFCRGPVHQGKSLRRWVAELSSRDLQTSVRAKDTLVSLGPAAEPVIGRITEVLASQNPRARELAASTLIGLGSHASSAIPDLTRLLSHQDPDVCRRAAGALSGMGREARTAIPELARLTRHPDESVRVAAIFTLGYIGDDALPLLHDVFVDGTNKAREIVTLSMKRIGASAVPVLVRLLGHADPSVRAPAAKALYSMGRDAGPAIPNLIRSLQDSDTDVQRWSAMTLAHIARKTSGPQSQAPREALPALTHAAHDKNPLVRFAAINALGIIADVSTCVEDKRQVLRTVIAAAGETDPNVREIGVAMTGAVGASLRRSLRASTRPFAKHVQGDDDPDVKLAVAVLLASTTDSRERTRRSAASYLRQKFNPSPSENAKVRENLKKAKELNLSDGDTILVALRWDLEKPPLTKQRLIDRAKCAVEAVDSKYEKDLWDVAVVWVDDSVEQQYVQLRVRSRFQSEDERNQIAADLKHEFLEQ